MHKLQNLLALICLCSGFLQLSAQDETLSQSEFQRRGIERFMEGRFMEAIEDFDRVIELEPRMAPGHWQRGIACYYAGEFKKGVAQFELHQTVNPEDVENAVWHFLCKARLDGIDAARKALIPIQKAAEKGPSNYS